MITVMAMWSHFIILTRIMCMHFFQLEYERLVEVPMPTDYVDKLVLKEIINVNEVAWPLVL